MDPRTPSDAADAADLRADDPALRGAAPGGDDAAARRARAAIEARLFGGSAAPEPAPAPEAGPPAQVGRYVIESRLGAGGMGVVYRAHDPELDRHVAVKLLSAEVAAHEDERARLRMLREARAMARLAHPNVIHVYDVGTVGDQVFVAMELVDGPSLARWLGAGARGWQEVLARFLAAGEGLAAAHRAGLIHRDFKPENVLVGGDGRVRVLDFGLARTASGGRGAGEGEVPATIAGELGEAAPPTLPGSLQASLTRTGALLGTPRYMSREQCLGRQADARSDLFSFCVALYEGLYGRMPFAGDTVDAYLQSVIAGELREPPPGAAPAWLWPVLRRGLDPDPAARYPDMEGLLAALRGPAAAAGRRRWPLWGLVGLAGAALVGWLAVARDGREGDARAPAIAMAPGLPAIGAGAPSAGTTGAPPAPTTGGDGPIRDRTAAPDDPAATGPASGGEASTGGGPSAPAATTAAPTKSPRRQDWCYMDEDRYLLLARMPRRRSHLQGEDGRCYVCRPESRPERVRRFQPADCGAYQVCGRAAAEACP